MATLQFVDSNYAILYKGTPITFYPKEYELFYFLYHHPNQLFSREQLLNHIWRNENPVDRTVDDHIYRIRKKIKAIKDIQVKTIRSSGYQLIITKPELPPSTMDSNIKRITTELMNEYKRLGQGNQILLLEKYKDDLGVPIDPFYQLYSKIIEGKFHWAIDTNEYSFWEKSYFLLQFYYMIQFDAHKSLMYFEKALHHHKMPQSYEHETKLLKIVDLYLETDQLHRAQQTLDLATAHYQHLAQYILPIKIKSIYIYLRTGDWERLEKEIKDIESTLVSSPSLRDQGNFLMAKGIWLLFQGENNQGNQLIQSGLTHLKESGFSWFYIKALHTILFYLEQHLHCDHLMKDYMKQWKQLSQDYQFNIMEEKLLEQFDIYL